MSLKIKIGGVPEHFNLPWHLLIDDKKFLSHHEIEIDWNDIHGGTGDMVKLLDDESLDVCVLLTEGIVKAIHQGLKAKWVNIYVASSLKWGIHVPFDSAIESVDDIDLMKHFFAISRMGSGSHLMTYPLVKSQMWDESLLKFYEVGSLEGGLKALENNKAQIFLWEKYTTHPFVLQKRCKFVGEIPTPWPCFSIAATNSFYSKHSDILLAILQRLMFHAKNLKENTQAVSIISKRYNLKEGQAKKWLFETDWNYSLSGYDYVYEEVLQLLKEMNVVEVVKKG